jgi:hypothetical protein
MKAINSMKMTAVAVVASLALVTFSQAQAQERREQKATRVYEQPKNERKLNEPRKADSYANYDNRHEALRKDKGKHKGHAYGHSKHKHGPKHQVVVYDRPHHHKIVYRKMPKRAVAVRLDNSDFYFYSGQFYKNSVQGFYVVETPRHVRYLPHGTVQIWVNGAPIYKYHDIVFIPTRQGFKVHI